MINEFTGKHWQDKPDPLGIHKSLGDAVLASRSFPTEYWWVWVSVGAAIAGICVFNAALIVAHAWLPGED